MRKDFGRDEFVKAALRNAVPIIPFVTVGNVEIFPVLAKLDWAWWKRLSGWPCLPIAPPFRKMTVLPSSRCALSGEVTRTVPTRLAGGRLTGRTSVRQNAWMHPAVSRALANNAACVERRKVGVLIKNIPGKWIHESAAAEWIPTYVT